MKIGDNCFDEQYLSKLGSLVVELLIAQEFESIVERFGYARALGRDPVSALESDLSDSLPGELVASQLREVGEPTISVEFLDKNESNLAAIVECLIPLTKFAAILVELAVTSDGNEKHISVEDISRAA